MTTGRSAANPDKLSPQEREVLLRDLLIIERAMRLWDRSAHPGHYGMPDLLFPKGFMPGTYVGDDAFLSQSDEELGDGWIRQPIPGGETDEQYTQRRRAAIRSFVEDRITIPKGHSHRGVKTIPQMIDLIVDVFYLKNRRVILWKPRGGGGSLTAAVIIFLLAVYRKMSVLNTAGSSEQAKAVYRYVQQLWYLFPGMPKELLACEPTQSEIKLRTGAVIQCVPLTEKQVRGKHQQVFVSDETAQHEGSLDGQNRQGTLKAALQTAMSEDDSIIIMVSTFHVPQGLFQEYWDHAAERGVARHRWNVFHTMKPCRRGLEFATADDPTASAFCQKCLLTYPDMVLNEQGKRVQVGWAGCNGQARTSDGWVTFESVAETYMFNLGSDVFDVEYACFRGDAPVMTERGWIPIKDVKDGDLVLTGSGNWKTAHPMSRRYTGDLVRVWPRGSQAVYATPEHPFWSAKRKYGYSRNDLGVWEWARAGDLTKYHAIRFPKPRLWDAHPIQYGRTVGGRKPHVEFRTVERGFDFGLFLGLLFGDGFYEVRKDGSVRLGLGEAKEKGNIQEFARVATKLFGRRVSVRGDGYRLASFGETGFARYLMKYGRYCHEKSLPPDIFKSMPPDEARGFLVGSLSTNGSVDGDSTVRFCTTSMRLAGNIYALLVREGFTPSLVRARRAGVKSFWGKDYKVRDGWVIGVGGLSGRCLLDWLRSGSERRDGRCSVVHSDMSGVSAVIRSVSTEPFVGLVYNLSVDDDQTYVVGGMVVHNCRRPTQAGAIYDPEALEKSIGEPLMVCPEDEKVVGIDWGMSTKNSLCMLLAVKKPDRVYVHETIFVDHVVVSSVVHMLNDWRAKYGDFEINADSSHPFNNADLARAGFRVNRVNFGKWKSVGIRNIGQFMVFRRIHINKECTMLINQLRRYHMNASTGAVVKQDDHGADAMMCAVLKWRFDDTFGADIAKAGVLADAIAHHEMENPEDSPLEPVQAQEIEEPGVPDMAVHYRTRRRGLMVAGVNTPTIAVPVGLTRKPSGPAQARIF